MVDFSKLLDRSRERGALSPDDRRALDARERFASDAPHVARDEAVRDEHSLEHRVVVLGSHADTRHVNGMRDVTGERRSENVLKMAYRDDGRPLDGRDGEDFRTIVHFESEADRITGDRGGIDRIDALARATGAGVKVSVLGRDVERSWKRSDDTWAKTTEFHAQRIGLGELTREQLTAREPGGLADASERYVATRGDEARESIARAYLGQDPVLEGGARVRGITRGPTSGSDHESPSVRATRGGNER